MQKEINVPESVFEMSRNITEDLSDPPKMQKNSDQPIDEYTKAIGESGRWQICLFIALAIPIKIVLNGIHMGIIFIAPKTTFRCVERSNSSEAMMNVTCYSDCVKYEYFSDFDDSIITQWDLVCDRAWLANLAQTVCMFGILGGDTLFGFISDRYGRRPTLILAGLLETCTAFAMPFCTNYWLFIVVRFFLGAATAGTMITSFVFLMEIFGSNIRELLGCIFMIPVGIGLILTTVVAYYIRTWQDISLCIAVPTLVFLTYALYLPESPKWLISMGRLEEASVVMTNAAKWNNLLTDNMLATVEAISKEAPATRIERKATFLDLLTLSSLRFNMLCSAVAWFAVGISLFGVTQYIGQTTSNVFVLCILTGTLMLPAFMIGGFLSKLIGRRWTIMGFFIVSFICNGLLILSDDWYYVKLIAGTIGISCLMAVFSLLYVFIPELFPTVARNMAMGTASTANRVGSMIAPFVGALHTSAAWIPPFVFAIVPLAAVLAIYYLPETKGIRLKDHLEENTQNSK